MDAKDSSSEKLITWQEEAQAVIRDIEEFVCSIEVADGLESSPSKIFLNVTTLETHRFCVELSALGFRVVGNDYNVATSDIEIWFDTPYALLADISPSYHFKFANSLADRLQALSDNSVGQKSDPPS